MRQTGRASKGKRDGLWGYFVPAAGRIVVSVVGRWLAIGADEVSQKARIRYFHAFLNLNRSISRKK